MNPKIATAIQQAKTCAPTRCDNEQVCFILATEVERLYTLLEKENISTAEPSYEATEPMWEAS
jgi:hypothetical protein